MTTTTLPDVDLLRAGALPERAAMTARATWYPTVLRHVCQWAHTSPTAVENGSRAPEAVKARRVIMGTARALGLSTPAIACLLGQDHSTVMYGLRALTKNAGLVRANTLALDLATAIQRPAAIVRAAG